MRDRTKIALTAGGIAAGMIARTVYQRSRERSIAGDVVLITGGSRGLGLALARRFAREGCRVAICARDAEELGRAREDLAKRGAHVFTIPCDVTRKEEVDLTIADVTRHFGRIDILVNNAGQIQVGPLESVSVEDFEDAMNVMFWGTVYPTLAVLPEFMKRNGGHVVNITSIGGKVAIPHLLPYTSAKHAAVGFSEGLHAELAETGVRVTTIAPGLMRTGSYNAAQFKGDQAAEAEWFSLGASLPGISMGAERAARQIVMAVKRGDAEKVLSAPANVLAKIQAVAPGLTGDLVAFASGLLLPKAGSDRHAQAGWSLENLKSPKMRALLMVGRMAARRLNQRTA
jgi:NAD(P)-dependent dehydrogenase (short-subunit alcohol dehydrogenase family)